MLDSCSRFWPKKAERGSVRKAGVFTLAGHVAHCPHKGKGSGLALPNALSVAVSVPLTFNSILASFHLGILDLNTITLIAPIIV